MHTQQNVVIKVPGEQLQGIALVPRPFLLLVNVISESLSLLRNMVI
jgi:hypothetical protein